MAQGKTAYARKNFCLPEDVWVDGADCHSDEIYTCRAIRNFHEYIRRFLTEEEQPELFVQKLFAANPGLVIVTDEIGCGLVPLDACDRRYREQTGRICTKLAGLCDEVHRVVCGIGTVIKASKGTETFFSAGE
jgi:adenosylcobinamide kinase/adenosylcobinamide-phosphate guanylyltransferase